MEQSFRIVRGLTFLGSLCAWRNSVTAHTHQRLDLRLFPGPPPPAPPQPPNSDQANGQGQGWAGAGAPAGHTRWRSDIGQSSEPGCGVARGPSRSDLEGKQASLDLASGAGTRGGTLEMSEARLGSGALLLPLVTHHPRRPKQWGWEQWQWEGQRCCVGVEVGR